MLGGGWWVESAWSQNPAILVSWVFWVVVSIVLHELGHGFAAIRAGDRTPIELGHMTPNPVVHMGPMSLLALALFGIAWGAMPVDPSRFRGRWDELKVAAAGPAVNVGLAVLAGLGGGLFVSLAGGAGEFQRNVSVFFRLGCVLNVALVILNLLPIPPLDGSRILAELSAGYRRLLHHPNAQTFGLVAFLVAFMFLTPYMLDAGVAVNDALRSLFGRGSP